MRQIELMPKGEEEQKGLGGGKAPENIS